MMVTIGPVEESFAISVCNGIESPEMAPSSRDTSLSRGVHVVGAGTTGPVCGNATVPVGDCGGGGMGNGAVVLGSGVDVG
jgi:hypothetical protein